MQDINSLPTELLIAILLRTFASEATIWPRQLGKLYLTCWRWHAVIDTIPAFWSRISNKYHADYNSRALIQSLSHPLDIVCELNRFDNINAAFKGINKHADRWRSIKFKIPITPETEQLLNLLDTPGPFLESVTVVIQRPFRIPTFPNFMTGSTTRLKHVDVSGLDIPWDSVSFQGLVSLRVRLAGGLCPSATQVLRVLQRCPELEALCLVFTSSESITSPHVSIPSKLPLPFLQDLRISCPQNLAFGMGIITGIVGRPCHSQLSIDLYDENPIPQPLVHVVTDFLPSNMAKGHLSLAVSPTGVRLLAHDDGKDERYHPLILSLSTVAVPDTLKTLRAKMDASLCGRVRVLNLHGSQEDWQPEETWVHLAAFTDVERIWVRGNALTEEVLQNLRDSRCFPRLDTLEISACGRRRSAGFLLSMLRDRFPPGWDGSRPVPFKRITISRLCPEEELEAIEHLLDEDVLALV